MRPRLRITVLLLLVALVIGVYGYFTTPLPFGLSAVIRTPGGSAATPPAGPGAAAIARSAAGQPLILGALRVTVQSVQRDQDLTSGNRGGPSGSFTLVQLELQNTGAEPVTFQPNEFRLLDNRGRAYAVDLDATRSANAAARRRVPFDTTLPPDSVLNTVLAFETPSDASGLALRVTLGYGDLELPG
jgi:hypothetical protein